MCRAYLNLQLLNAGAAPFPTTSSLTLRPAARPVLEGALGGLTNFEWPSLGSPTQVEHNRGAPPMPPPASPPGTLHSG